MLGDANVGKSSIITRYLTGNINTEYGPTVGGVFYKKDHQIDSNMVVTLNFWDTAGEERFRAMAPMYFMFNSDIIEMQT